MINLRLLVTLGSIALASPSTSYGQSNEAQNHTRNNEGWFYGAFASHKSSPYKGYRNETKALPAIGYKSDRFNLMGPMASYAFLDDPDEQLKSSLIIQYRSLGFEAKDSVYLTGLSDRGASIFAGLSVQKKSSKWTYKLSYLGDIQGRSHGEETKFSISYFHNIGPLFVTPEVRFSYLDNNFSNYYYGVDQQEALPDRPTYQPGETFIPSLSLGLATPIFFKGFTRIHFSYDFLSSEVNTSPLIDKTSTWQTGLSFTRFF